MATEATCARVLLTGGLFDALANGDLVEAAGEACYVMGDENAGRLVPFGTVGVVRRYGYVNSAGRWVEHIGWLTVSWVDGYQSSFTRDNAHLCLRLIPGVK